MARFSKIPKELRGKAVACGKWAVFAGVFKAALVASELNKINAKKTIPICGYIIENKIKIYYVAYGFVNDDDVYSK